MSTGLKIQMIILTLILIVTVLLAAAAYSKRYRAAPSAGGPPTDLAAAPEALQGRLRAHVDKLAGQIGERNLWRHANLQAAAGYIEGFFADSGYEVKFQRIVVEGKETLNLEVELPGASLPEEILVIGAHYDSVMGSPGANDNASGVAALLEIAGACFSLRPARTLRFVAFVNEEPPLYRTRHMGSLVYARHARKQKEKIVAMIALETIGYYTENEESQAFPFPPLRFFYPTTGNFITFVSHFPSRSLLRRSLGAFRRHSDFPAEGLVAPGWLVGVGWSDHWSFWQAGYPAIMITDTALFRYTRYHSPGDTPARLNYPEMTRVVRGLIGMVAELSGGAGDPGVKR